MTGRSDLLADLQVDRTRLQPVPARPAPTPAPPAAARSAERTGAGAPVAGAPAAVPPPVLFPEAAVAPVSPALELRLTPLHWSRPTLSREGTVWTARLGPWHAAVVLP